MFESLKFAERNVFLLSKDLQENIMHKFSFYYTQPREMERLTNTSVLESPHLVCEPTKKNYFLFLTNYMGNKYCIFIDLEKDKCYFTRFRFEKDLFTDTVFQGEFIVNKNNKWVFRINDLLALKGQQLNAIHLSDRLKNIKEILDKQYIWDEYMNTCYIDIKPYFTYDFLSELEEVKELWFVPQHMFDPIYFIKFGDNADEVKETKEEVKERELWLHNTWKPDLFEVKDDDQNDLGYAYVKSLNDSKELRKIVQKDPVKMKCVWNDRFQKWMPIL